MDISIIKNTKDFLRAEGQNLVLLQDPSVYTFSRDGNSLLISTADGDEALVEDFFVLDEGASLPVFVVGSGESIEGADFLSAMSPQLDIETAAGPASSTAQGSGSGEYADAAGELIDGLDRLGSLGTSQWDLALDTAELLVSDSSALGEAPTTPDIPKNFFVRGVMYNDGNTDDFVAINIFFPNGDGLLDKLEDSEINFSGQNPSARYQVEIGTPDGWDKSWVAVSYNSKSGRMEFKLTAEGVAEMQRLELESSTSFEIKSLFDFITVEVVDSNNPNNVFGYLVEIVAGDTSHYSSDDKNNIDHAEGYPVDGKELIGEYHHGKGQDGPYNIISSNINDEITINDRVIGDSHINSGSYGESGSYPMAGGSDTIFLNKGMEGSSLGASYSTITANRGTVIALSDSDDVLFGTNNSSNTIWAKNIEIKGSASGKSALYAEDGAKNSLDSYEGGGKITVSGFHGLHAFDNGGNFISIKDGTVDIKASEGGYAMYAGSGGRNMIAGEGKGSVISTSGTVYAEGDGSSNVIYIDEGKYIGDGSHIAKDGGGTMITADSIEISGLVRSETTLSTPTEELKTWSILDAGNNGSVKLSGGVESEGFGALVRIKGGDLSIKGDSVAISAKNGGVVDIEAGKFELIVNNTDGSNAGRAVGFENIDGSNIVSVDNNATIEVTGKGFAAAFYNTGTGQQELNLGGDLTVNVKSNEADAFGVKGSADISASSVTMTIKGDLSAIVMDGKGIITGDTIKLTAESAKGKSYGMYNDVDSNENIIQSMTGQALNLEINAQYAMHASSGKNSIIGHSVSGGIGDLITLNGDIYQSGSGHNSVLTGSGDDRITINGAISGAGAIYIDGGDGYDTLILKADSAADFVTKYGAWLNSLDSEILKGIENIEFSGITDLSELYLALGDFFDYAKGAGIDINGQSIDDLFAPAAAFGAEAEALEESALLAGLPGLPGQSDQADDEDDNSSAIENEYSDSSVDYAASIGELDLSDLLRDGESETSFEDSMGKVYTDEPSSNESIFQNLSESIVDITDIRGITGIVDSNENEQSLDILLGGTEGSSSQELQAEISEEELVATLSLDQAAAKTTVVNSPSAFLDVDTDTFGNIDEGTEQTQLQLDVLSNFN